jgi:hypothetical protein
MFLTLASSRHNLKPTFLQKKFYEKISNLRIIKKTVSLRKIRQGFSQNSPPASLYLICYSWPQSRHWGWDGLGRHLVPPLLAVNCSSFALFFLIIGDLGLYIDVSCSS